MASTTPTTPHERGQAALAQRIEREDADRPGRSRARRSVRDVRADALPLDQPPVVQRDDGFFDARLPQDVDHVGRAVRHTEHHRPPSPAGGRQHLNRGAFRHGSTLHHSICRCPATTTAGRAREARRTQQRAPAGSPGRGHVCSRGT